MPTLKYYDGAAYQPLPGMPGPTGPIGPAGPTGAQGPVAPGVTPNYVAQGWGPATATTGTVIMTLAAPGLKANHNYLVTGWVVGSNTSAANAQIRFGLNNTAAGNSVGPNQGVWIKWQAANANDVTLPNQWASGTSASFIYTPAADGDQTFQIFNIGTAGAVQVAANQAFIAVADLTGTQGPIGATGATGPAGPAGGGSIIVSARAGRVAALTLTGSDQVVVMDTKQWDTQNAYSLSTGLFTCSQAGKYKVVGQVVTAASTAAGQWASVSIYKNGAVFNQNYSGYTQATGQYMFGQVVDTVDLAVGDTVGIYARCSVSVGISNAVTNTYLAVDLLSGTGPQGATGPTGPAYAAGQMYSLVYYQTVPAPKVASNPYTVTHNLGTTFPMVQLWDAITLQLVNAQVQVVDANRVQITVAADMPNPVNVTVMGVAASPVPINPGDLATKAYVDAKTATLPAPVTSGSGVQSFTDALGDVWVAANGVKGGNWYRARDVLHARWYRNAAWNTSTTEVAFNFDAGSDGYGMYVPASATFTIPIPGIWRTEMQAGAVPTASGQWLQALMRKGDGTGLTGGVIYASAAAGVMGPVCAWQGLSAAGDTILTKQIASVAIAGVTSWTWTHLYIAYLGTG